MNRSSDAAPRPFLVVEDDPNTAVLIGQTLRSIGVRSAVVSTCRDAYQELRRREFACVVLDMNLPDGTGREIQQVISRRENPPSVVFVTSEDRAGSAIGVLRAGAVEYVVKRPEYLDELRDAIVTRVGRERESVVPTVPGEREARTSTRSEQGLVGDCRSMREVKRRIERCAVCDVAVLITGETGTGKELVARAIHDAGPRADEPFVAINCASIAGTLFESELFGVARGAFTGAVRDRGGLFAAAREGTLFLDEIGELPLDAQAKLLRVLEDKTYRRVGDTREFRSGARIITATNRDLPSLVERGRFRSDLFYRLDVMHVALPPLRERLSDLPLLVDHFLRLESAEFGDRTIGADALESLNVHSWPGNVRELRHTITRTLAWSDAREISRFELRKQKRPRAGDQRGRVRLDWNAIATSLRDHDGRLGPTADALQVSTRTLQRRMRELGMRTLDFR